MMERPKDGNLFSVVFSQSELTIQKPQKNQENPKESE